jgi:hypothetical protein
LQPFFPQAVHIKATVNDDLIPLCGLVVLRPKILISYEIFFNLKDFW